MARGWKAFLCWARRVAGSREPFAQKHLSGRVGLWIVAVLVIIGAGGAAILYTRSRPEGPITHRISPGFEEAAGIDAQPAMLRDFNVLLITMDTTRADHLHAYGNAGVETPHLDGLAREGVLFSQAITPSPSTLPAHSHANRDTDAHCDANRDTHRDAHCDANRDTHRDAHRDAHCDTDCHAHRDAHRDADSYSDRNANGHTHA
jgi:hypothetical protein